MKASGCEVYATCTVCGWSNRALALDPIIEKLGEDYSLFDKRPACRQVVRGDRCRGRVLFMYRPPGIHGTPFRPCKTTL